MGKVRPSYMQQEKSPNSKVDLCPMCDKSLYLNDEYTQRVGLLDEDDYCTGWMCPHCDGMFDTDDNLTGINGMDEMGEAQMPKFGRTSKKRLATCDKKLQDVFNEVIKHVDCSVLEGNRSELTQNKYYAEGKSKFKFPGSKHNSLPSRAADVTPYPVDWEDRERQTLFAGFVIGIAKGMGIDLRWGGDWDMDFQVNDNKFDDFPHFEVKG